MDTPLTPSVPAKIPDVRMERERGEAGEPGQLVSRLETAGLPVSLGEIVDQRAATS